MTRVVQNPITRALWDADELAEALCQPGSDSDEASQVTLLLDSVRRWCSQEIDAERFDREADIPDRVLRSAAELGLFGLSIPEAFGGLGLSTTATCRVIEEVARSDASLAVSIGLHGGLGVRGLVEHGSEALKQRYLPRLARGEWIAAFGSTEPGAGSDLSAIATTARQMECDILSIQGQKAFVTNGRFAALFTLLVRSDRRGGGRGDPRRRRPAAQLLVLVPRDAAGVSVGAEEHKLGLRASSTTPVYFEDVRVPADHVLGDPSRSRGALDSMFSVGRLSMAAGCLGGARACTERALEHAGSRRQFGRPLDAFGQVRERLTRSCASLYAMESVIRLVGRRLEDGDPETPWLSQVAKVYCSDALWRAADDALQIHGGSGFLETTGIARRLRDSRVTRIFEGANEVLRFQLAARAVLFPFEGVPQVFASRLPDPLRDLGARFEQQLERVRAALAGAHARWGAGLFERQVVLSRMSNALVALVVMQAVILRTRGELRRHAASRELALARYLGRLATRQVEAGLDFEHWEAEEAAIAEVDLRDARDHVFGEAA